MAEPKVKPVNGNHAADKTSTTSKLRQLLELAREVTKDADAIESFETSVELRKSLEEQLEAKNAEAQRLREFNDKVAREYSEFRIQAKAKEETIFAEFEQRYKRYDSNIVAVETMEKQVLELEQKISDCKAAERAKQEEIERLLNQLQITKSENKSQSDEIKNIRSECDAHRASMQTGIAELDACKAKLADAEQGLGGSLLKEHNKDSLKKLGLDLKALSKECHSLALEYFFDPDGAKDSASEIQDLKARFPKVPLSTAATKSAAQMRCAVAEAVLADILTNQIFVPFYLSNGMKTAAASLLDLFGDDEKVRSLYRVQVLRSMKDAEEVKRIEDDIIRRASNEARTTLHPLVSAFKQAGFFNAIPTLFRQALRLWADVQYSRELITAETLNLDEELHPGRFDDYDQHQGGARVAKNKATIAAVLFPQVVTREDIIFNGMALWSSQVTVIPTPPISNTNGDQGRGHHTRRKSVVGGEAPLKSRQIVNGA